MIKKRITFLLLTMFFFLVKLGISQETKDRESQLQKEWQQKSPEEIYKTFTDFYSTNDTLAMRIAAEIILTNAKENDNATYYIMGYHRLSDYYRIREKYQEALSNIDIAIKYLEEIPDFYNKTQLFLLQGNLNRYLGRYEKSIASHLVNLALAKENKNDFLALTSRIAIAKVKAQVYNPKEAIEISFEGLQIIKDSEDPSIKKNHDRFLTNFWTIIANAYIAMNDYENGLLYSRKLIEKGKEINNNNVIVTGVLGLSDIYSLTDQYEKALLNLETFDKIDNASNKAFFEPFAHLYYARIYFNIHKYDEALKRLKKIEELQEEQSFDFFLLQEIYVLYAKIYQSLGNIEESLQYFNKANNIYKNNAEDKNKLSQSIIERYNLIDFNNEIETLSYSSKFQKRVLTFLLIGVFIMIALSIFYFFRLKKKNKEKFDALLLILDKNQNKEAKDNENKNSHDTKLKSTIDKLERIEKELFFLDTRMTLHQLAKKLNTNTTYLSRIINEEKNLSFSKYITKLRIDYSLYKLRSDRKFRLYSIKALAKEVGFQSITPFINAFKEKTGLTPAYFIKKLNKTNFNKS